MARVPSWALRSSSPRREQRINTGEIGVRDLRAYTLQHWGGVRTGWLVPVFGQGGRGRRWSGQTGQHVQKQGHVKPHTVPSRLQAVDEVQGWQWCWGSKELEN